MSTLYFKRPSLFALSLEFFPYLLPRYALSLFDDLLYPLPQLPKLLLRYLLFWQDNPLKFIELFLRFSISSFSDPEVYSAIRDGGSRSIKWICCNRKKTLLQLVPYHDPDEHTSLLYFYRNLLFLQTSCPP